MIDETLHRWERRNWISVGELAAFFEVHPRTIINWWRKGRTCLVAFHPEAKMLESDNFSKGHKGFRFTARSVIIYVQSGIVQPDDMIGGEF